MDRGDCRVVDRRHRQGYSRCCDWIASNKTILEVPVAYLAVCYHGFDGLPGCSRTSRSTNAGGGGQCAIGNVNGHAGHCSSDLDLGSGECSGDGAVSTVGPNGDSQHDADPTPFYRNPNGYQYPDSDANGHDTAQYCHYYRRFAAQYGAGAKQVGRSCGPE